MHHQVSPTWTKSKTNLNVVEGYTVCVDKNQLLWKWIGGEIICTWLAIGELERWKHFFSSATTQESSSPSGGNVEKMLVVFYLYLILISIMDEGSTIKVLWRSTRRGWRAKIKADEYLIFMNNTRRVNIELKKHYVGMWTSRGASISYFGTTLSRVLT